MNTNFTRTLLYILSAVVLLVPVFLGCTQELSGNFNCSNSWLPPQFASIAAMVLMVLAVVLKSFGGEGLFTTGSSTFRSILTFGGIAVTAAVVFFGCTNIGTSIECSASWLGPFWGSLVASILLGVNLVVKKFDGTTLTKPVV